MTYKPKGITLPLVVVHQTDTTNAFDIVAPNERGGELIATCGVCVAEDSVPGNRARYLVHAANEYPRAIEALRSAHYALTYAITHQKLTGNAVIKIKDKLDAVLAAASELEDKSDGQR